MANSTSYKDIIDQCHLQVLDSLKSLGDELTINIGRALERKLIIPTVIKNTLLHLIPLTSTKKANILF